jgi:YgiT-type zinc finger domain-containing protein
MNCLIRKFGIYKPDKITVKLERGKSIVLIKEVPADVCDICGNYLLNQKTTRAALEHANQSFESGAELEITKLKAA